MTTAKKLGFKKGDWALMRGTNWEIKLISDVHTAMPTGLVFGWVTEAGSIPSGDLVKLPYLDQVELEEKHADKVRRFKTPLTIA